MNNLIEMYGPDWHINAPPNAKPAVLEGFIDVTNPPRNSPLVVCNHTLSENTVIVIHRLYTEYFDINPLGVITACHPACQAGRLSWSPRTSKRIEGTMSTDFKRLNGFVGAPGGKASETGLSWAGLLNLERAPIIVDSGKSFDIVLNIIDLAAGQPIEEGNSRSFYAKATGFTLITV